jgi:uncharacterized membrane protein YgdD (TMEM256/DUF423 family)
MNKVFLFSGSLLAMLGVITGAFGSHAFKDYLLQTHRLDTFETAVRYQFYHALGLIFIGILSQLFPNKNFTPAGYLMLSGVIIFSGSLYLLCFTGAKWLGAVTPIGGVLMIVAWGWMAFSVNSFFSNQ